MSQFNCVISKVLYSSDSLGLHVTDDWIFTFGAAQTILECFTQSLAHTRHTKVRSVFLLQTKLNHHCSSPPFSTPAKSREFGGVVGYFLADTAVFSRSPWAGSGTSQTYWMSAFQGPWYLQVLYVPWQMSGSEHQPCCLVPFWATRLCLSRTRPAWQLSKLAWLAVETAAPRVPFGLSVHNEHACVCTPSDSQQHTEGFLPCFRSVIQWQPSLAWTPKCISCPRRASGCPMDPWVLDKRVTLRLQKVPCYKWDACSVFLPSLLWGHAEGEMTTSCMVFSLSLGLWRLGRDGGWLELGIVTG